MKKTILSLAFAMICTATFAQSKGGFGIKGGLNYNSNGDYIQSAQAIAEDPDGNVGFHLGVFYKIGNSIYFRPELVYTNTKSKYTDGDLNINKIDLPALIGIRLIGPLHLFAGPDFQYILNSKFDGIKLNDIENDFTVGLHVGVGVNLGKLGVDLRYERGFTSNEANFINTNITTLPESRVDTRSSQVIVSLSVKI
ncbi:MAG: porin family protein [Flavobacteriaceae bacterium]